MKMHRYTKKTIALVLAAAMALGLAGCRMSDEIQKIVYTQDASEVDDTEVTRRWEQEAEEQDDKSDELQEEEDEETTDEEMEEDQISSEEDTDDTAPAEGDTSNTDEAAQIAAADETGNNDVTNDSDSMDGSNAVNSSANDQLNENSDIAGGQSGDSDASQSADETDGTGDGSGANDAAQDGSTGSDGNSDGSGSTSEAGDNTSGEGTEPRKQIYDTDGNLIDLPDSVDTIVAAGEAALITQMLGGEGVLLGASSDFLNNSLVQSVFADEGIAEVASLWSGDGSSPMSDESFEELLELNPDCVLEISGETNFSSDQETQLKAAQIYIVTLPELTTSEYIQTAVEIVGQTLDDHAVGDTTSLALAEEYVTYEENLVTEVQSRKGTYHKYLSGSAYGDYFSNISSTISNGDFAMILWDWDDSFSFTYSYNGTDYISQSGGAVTNGSVKGNPATYYLAVAGVMNTSGAGSGETLFVPFYYLGASDDITDADQNQDRVTTSAAIGSLGFYGWGSLGMSGSSYSSTYGTTYTYSSSNYEVTGYSMWAALGLSRSDIVGYVSGTYAWLGTAQFPYVIAASQEIQERMNASKNSSTGLYAIRTWGIYIDDTIASIAQDRIIFYNNTKPGQSSLVVNQYTTSRQEYDIIVNPSGCGDWLTGSVESVLESVWISNLYWGDDTYSDADRNAVIADFYKTFYRHELSSGELADILDGE